MAPLNPHACPKSNRFDLKITKIKRFLNTHLGYLLNPV